MRYMMLLGFAGIFALYAAHLAAADLVGTVRDAKGHTKQGVDVSLNGAEQRTLTVKRGTKTTNAGEFAFSGIPPGAYTLACGGVDGLKVTSGGGIIRKDLSCP